MKTNSAFPFDLAVASDAANLVIGIVPGVFRAGRHGPRGSGVNLLPAAVGQALRAGVAHCNALGTGQSGPAAGRARRRRGRGLRLQRAMHALMPAVLLRRGRMDEVRRDAELHPPNRQLGEAASAPRTERRAIVAADRQRQAVLAESPLKTRANALDGGGDNPQFDQKAAVTVGYRQRIDPPLVAGAEPALEVCAPLIIDARHRRAGPSLVKRTTAPLYRRHQTCPLENGPDRGGRRPGDPGGLAVKHRQKLAGPQIRKSPPRRDHLRCNRIIRGLRALQGRMRAV